jgi:hypothetical protein
MALSCQKKRLYVNVGAEYPNSVGFFGKGKYKIDNQKPMSFKYQVDSPFDAVFLTSPKSFLKDLAKAKSKVSFQIDTLMGIEILDFPIGNLKAWRQTFATAGCKF